MSATLEGLLRHRTGLEAAALAPDAVAHAAAKRREALGLPDGAAYLARVNADPGEWTAFLEEVVVHETWFFRDGGPFEALARWLAAASPASSPRILSMPCGTGEEAYSIAMVLDEAGLPASAAPIDAVDLSPRALEAARRGVYGPASFRGAEIESRRHRFRTTDAGLEIEPALRDRVRFHESNALAFGGPRPVATYDVVFCRNLFIYLGEEARALLAARIDALLAPGGLVFLGHAETPSRFFPSYRPLASPRAFGGEKAAAAPALPRAPLAAAPPAARPAPARERLSEAASPLERARHLADRGELAAAAVLCEEVLARDAASPEAHYLRAVVAHAARDEVRAEAELRKTLYLAPAHRGALVQLGLVLESSGRPDEAGRLRRRASRTAAGSGA